MRDRQKRVQFFAIGFLLLFAAGLPAWGKSTVPRITKEDLLQKMNDPNVAIIDVRTGFDWQKSNEKIKGAVREDPERVKDWAKKYPLDKTLVLYCA